jgi:hypothetical protein
LGAALVFALARLTPFSWMRSATLAMPLAVLGALLIISAFASSGEDTLISRLAISGDAVGRMGLVDLLGFANGEGYQTQDSGYYYVLRSFGIVLLCGLWMAFSLIATPTPQAARFKYFVALYICLLLCVSSASLFAIKTAAFLWFALGAFTRLDPLQPKASI